MQRHNVLHLAVFLLLMATLVFFLTPAGRAVISSTNVTSTPTSNSGLTNQQRFATVEAKQTITATENKSKSAVSTPNPNTSNPSAKQVKSYKQLSFTYKFGGCRKASEAEQAADRKSNVYITTTIFVAGGQAPYTYGYDDVTTGGSQFEFPWEKGTHLVRTLRVSSADGQTYSLPISAPVSQFNCN
jgi:hypothetical protein